MIPAAFFLDVSSSDRVASQMRPAHFAGLKRFEPLWLKPFVRGYWHGILDVGRQSTVPRTGQAWHYKATASPGCCQAKPDLDGAALSRCRWTVRDMTSIATLSAAIAFWAAPAWLRRHQSIKCLRSIFDVTCRWTATTAAPVYRLAAETTSAYEISAFLRHA
jgi:hypothetical protein